MRYKILLEYIGTNTVGWQKQRSGSSIQQTVEQAIQCFTHEEVVIYGSGRTDAGVHALGQIAHFDLKDKWSAYTVTNALNYHLKNHAITILDTRIVSEDFHARFSAKSRLYKYCIVNRPGKLTLQEHRAWHVPRALDIQAMRKGAEYLYGKHDFSSFRAYDCQATSPIKTLSTIEIKQYDDKIEIYYEAPSFLHKQVRIITGTLKAIGLHNISPETVKVILAQRNRDAAKETAPPYGLYLVKIKY